MTKLSAEQLADYLQSNPSCRIKIFNLGENAGQDLSYFCHYKALKTLFPNITLDLRRSNVDETNCIGFDLYDQYVKTPLSSIKMAVVKQRYQGGQDWVQKLYAGEKIFPDEFYGLSGHDLVWGIGMGGTEQWTRQLAPERPFIDSSTVKQAVEMILKGLPELKFSFKNIAPPDLMVPLDGAIGATPWERTALEYLSMTDTTYPFEWKPETLKSPLATQYRDYLRISLRWPDYVRWYYGIDKQYDVVIAVIKKIQESGRPVKLIYNLKDGEIGNNFQRGQPLARLKQIKDLVETPVNGQPGDIVFTYSWTANPYFGRQTEAQERAKLRSIGAAEDKILRLTFWDDLLQSSNCKVWLSDPGGFAEAISMLRPAESTFLFPVSQHHLGTYITLNQDNKPIRLKLNKVCVEQSYTCTPTVVEADELGPRRVKYWVVKFGDNTNQIGEDCRGNDHEYFAAAQNTVFSDWFDKTAPALINGIIEQYLK